MKMTVSLGLLLAGRGGGGSLGRSGGGPHRFETINFGDQEEINMDVAGVFQRPTGAGPPGPRFPAAADGAHSRHVLHCTGSTSRVTGIRPWASNGFPDSDPSH